APEQPLRGAMPQPMNVVDLALAPLSPESVGAPFRIESENRADHVAEVTHEDQLACPGVELPEERGRGIGYALLHEVDGIRVAAERRDLVVERVDPAVAERSEVF